MRNIGSLMIILILITLAGCESKEDQPKDYYDLKVDVVLPAFSETNTDLYIFADCAGTEGDVKRRLFNDQPGDFRLYRVEYKEKDAKAYLSKKHFQSYSSNFRGFDSSIYYKGGTIKDKTTMEGTAKTIVYFINGVGWYRIK